MGREFVLAAVVANVFCGSSAIAEVKAKPNAVDAGSEIAADIAAGEKQYMRECRACHGRKAEGVSSFPKLVGHPTDYLVQRLEQYRAGEKLGPNTPLMAAVAKELSDQDLSNLAGFIVSLPE